MNPILLKPTSDVRSQVVLLGEAIGNQTAMAYHREKTRLVQTANAALDRLRRRYDLIVIEGAGSCAEVNLMDHDIVNFSVAAYADAPLVDGRADRELGPLPLAGSYQRLVNWSIRRLLRYSPAEVDQPVTDGEDLGGWQVVHVPGHTAGSVCFHQKERGIAIFIIGHITKEGSIAGPRVLEHMVDTVLYFEGDRGNPFRLLRAIKNRFGATDEIGVFEMADEGLREVSNPSELFLGDRDGSAPGAAVFARNHHGNFPTVG